MTAKQREIVDVWLAEVRRGVGTDQPIAERRRVAERCNVPRRSVDAALAAVIFEAFGRRRAAA